MTPDAATRARTSLAYGLRSWSTWGLYVPLIAFLLVVWFFVPVPEGGCPNG